MYKKVHNVIVLAGFSSVCSIVFGMEQKCSLIGAIHKDIVPALSVNDYIITVSTAYQALKKEASFERDILRPIIIMANNRLRDLCRTQGILYRLRDSKTSKRMTNYVPKPYFKCIELLYKNKVELEDIDRLRACITVSTKVYYISSFAFKSVVYSQDQYTVDGFSALVKNNIIRLLPKGKPVFIELYSPGKISDVIKIENCFEFLDSDDCNFDMRNVVARSTLSREDSNLFHNRDADYNSLDHLGIRVGCWSFFLGTIVLTSALLGSLLYN